jgi:hypothetical protein
MFTAMFSLSVESSFLLPEISLGSTKIHFSRLAWAKEKSTPKAATRTETELIVGSTRGLEAWRRDGKSKRLIAPGVALSPRFLQKTSVLVIASQETNIAKGALLERIDLGTGKRSKVAKLPLFICKQRPKGRRKHKLPSELVLALQEPGDFAIDQSGKNACLTLMDGSANTFRFAVDVLVDLKEGRIKRWLTAGEDACIPPVGVSVAKVTEHLNCSTPEEEPSRSRKPQLPFSFDDDGLLRRGSIEKGEPLLELPWYEPFLNGGSPSGRWMILAGDKENSDFVHRNIVLLDREQGELYPIREQRTWPAPLRASVKANLPQIKTPIVGTAPVVDVTDVRWLGSGADSELLIIGDLVVRPGAYAFAVQGEIAR